MGKFNVIPTIDFDTEDKVDFVTPDIPITPKVPKVSYNPNYNPFNYSTSISKEDSDFEQGGRSPGNNGGNSSQRNHDYHRQEQVPANWDALFAGLEDKPEEVQTVIPEMAEKQEDHQGVISFVQMKGRYIVTPVHSGLMFIDQKRAHERHPVRALQGNVVPPARGRAKEPVPRNAGIIGRGFHARERHP